MLRQRRRIHTRTRPRDPRINHPEIRSIYPPHAQLLFALVHQLTALAVLVVALTRRDRILQSAVVASCARETRALHFAYATCPLVLFEGTWSGHIDAVAGVLLAIALLRDSGRGGAFASGLKIIPLAAVPALFAASRTQTFLLAFVAALAIPFLPFLGGPIMPGFRDYATRWIFNSPLYDSCSRSSTASRRRRSGRITRCASSHLGLRLSPSLHGFPDARGHGRDRHRLHLLRAARIDGDRGAAPLLAGDSSLVLADARAGFADRGDPLDLPRAGRADVVPAVRGRASALLVYGLCYGVAAAKR